MMLMVGALHSNTVLILIVHHIWMFKCWACSLFPFHALFAIFFILSDIFNCIWSRIYLRFAFHIEVVSTHVNTWVLSHASTCLNTKIHFIRSEFSTLACNLLLLIESFSICTVKTILKLVLISLDMILNHSAIFLFEFTRYFGIFKPLSTIIWGKLNSTLGVIALNGCWCHWLWKLITAHASITVHKIEILLIGSTSLGSICNLVSMMRLL